MTFEDAVESMANKLLYEFKIHKLMPYDTGYLRNSLISEIEGYVITLVPTAEYAYYVQFVPHASPHGNYLMNIFEDKKEEIYEYALNLCYTIVKERILSGGA